MKSNQTRCHTTAAAGAPDAGMGPVHFIGVGGVGMSGLATILLERGIRVSGSDAAESPALERLELLGARIAVGHAATNVGDAAQVVYSSAVQAENPEMQEALRLGLPCSRRGEFLARLAQDYETVVAIAGSHGKTTTSAMLSQILREAGLNPAFLVGGDVLGWAAPAGAGAGRILVTEVDESDGTQALMRTTHAVVTNVDDDHCWSLGGVEALEQCFVTFAARAARVYTWDAPTTRRLLATHPACALLGEADMPAGLELQLPGAHNRRNATLAVAVAEALGVPRPGALTALAAFQGVSRRLSERFRLPGGSHVVVEDYAHHPEELRASLAALQEKYPKHRLVVIFQPHRFERVKRYAAAFSEVFSQQAHEVIITPPFAAWLQDMDGANPRDIAAGVRGIPACYWEQSLEQLAEALVTGSPVVCQHSEAAVGARQPVVLAVVGAGDIAALVGLLRTRLVAAWRLAFHEALRYQLGVESQQELAWQDVTSLGVGSGRPLRLDVASTDMLVRVLGFCQGCGAPVSVLGAGTNLVGTDADLPGLVLRLTGPEFTAVTAREDGTWQCGAGVTLRQLYDVLLAGRVLPPAYAPLAWIPGTLGGAVRMNAGAQEHCIGEFVVQVAGYDADGTAWQGVIDSAAAPAGAVPLVWGYRQVNIPAQVIITSLTLRFPPADMAAAQAAYEQAGVLRRERQPAGRSAGCVFRNAGAVSAGRLLDQAGCKGLTRDHCRVSEKHANFILTDGHATEKEFVSLLLRLRAAVRRSAGLVLTPEVQFVNPETARKVLESGR